MIDFRRTQPEKKALLLDELDYWQYKYDSQSTNTNDYRNTLDSLYNVYGKEPFAAEIRIAEMNLLQRERYQGNKTPSRRSFIRSAKKVSRNIPNTTA